MQRFLYATVSETEDGSVLRDFLRRRFGLSAALLLRLKQTEDGICVNGIRKTVLYRLSAGETVRLNVGDCGEDSGFAERETPLDVLYEDSDLIVLNKPPFLAVHPSKGHVDDTLANALTYYYHQKGESFVSRCVLRLDRNTSGAVLFAKNAYAHDRLRRQLADGDIRKEYRALVHGEPPCSGTVNAPVYRPEQATLRRTADERGKPAVTDFLVEKSNGTLSLLRVFPRTGRTHQIRLHLSHIGHPIVSDFLYGDEADGVLSRHGLHCSSLSFLQPVTGKRICVGAPLCADIARICDALPSCERYRTLDRHLRETYGEKLVKIPLNGGFTCPNRKDGGCRFCSSGGSGEFAGSPDCGISRQLADGKRALKKWKGCRYIAYFQAFTNTYAPIERLRALYGEAISDPEVAILSVATRPDCLGDDVLELLSELNRKKPVWVELGLQTESDETAVQFGRGYPTAVYEQAAQSLRARGISVITHLIFGLPGEDTAQTLRSVRLAGRYSDGVKLQMLQILKGSAWGEQFTTAPFSLMTKDEYVSLVCEALSILPPHVTVHRLTGDPPSDLLIAPAWVSDKRAVLGAIRLRLEQTDAYQGKFYQQNETAAD